LIHVYDMHEWFYFCFEVYNELPVLDLQDNQLIYFEQVRSRL
jgi:hypothetical protein